MGGLLYKDYISVCHIKKVNLTWAFVIATFVFTAARMLFTGDALGYAETAMGTDIALVDLVFVSSFMLVMLIGVYLINSFTSKIIDNDEKCKVDNYLSALPLGKNTYAASKYLFLGIASYIFISISYIWGMVCLAYCEPGYMHDLCEVLIGSIVLFFSFELFIASIELPLNLKFGKEKAIYLKVAFLLIIAFIVIGFVLFDRRILTLKFDFTVIVEWFQKHNTEMIIIQCFQPVLVLILYYLSYRLSCVLWNRREM